MDRTYPFLISGILIIIGLVATSWLDARLNRYVTGNADTNFNPKLSGELAHLQPGQLRNVVLYWIDMTQAAALIIGPLLGLLILIHLSNGWVVASYAASILVGLGVILRLALMPDESKYSRREGRLGFTPVTYIGLMVDILAGLAAYLVGR